MRLIDADELKKIIKENDTLAMTGFSVRLCDIDNTPTIQAVPIEVLDKIRAEIMDFEEELFHRPNTDYTDYAAVRHCVEIIDKYRKEQE